ncbi:hypothetical protein [Pulveribacter sp.]|uniref:hypothetical protein n=1 Tax=Pulveribacter sp. TaxID=2678893 RepID=UPI0028ADAFF8|nr:hypothetical protein [Pulveribacter sp.]
MLVVYFNKNSARICRRREVRQADGAYKRIEERLGELPLDATALPSGLPELTDRERASLEVKFFAKAKAQLEQRRRKEQEQKTDPMRRIAAARTLLEEAAELSAERAVEHAELKSLLKVVLAMRSTEVLFPLEAVQEAAMVAATAVDSGVFGTRSDDEPLKNSTVTAQWNQTRDAVVGTDSSSLMRALQRQKWARTGAT